MDEFRRLYNSSAQEIGASKMRAFYIQCHNNGAWVKYSNDEETTRLFIKRIAERFSPITGRYIYASEPTIRGKFYNEDSKMTDGFGWQNGFIFLPTDPEDSSYMLFVHLKDVKKYGLKEV